MGIWQKKYTPLIIYAVLLLISLCPKVSLAQTYQETIDSLIQQLPTINEGEAHVDLLNAISYNNRRISGDSTLKYGRLAHTAAIKAGYIKGQSIAHKNMGIGFYKMSASKDSMVYHYEKAIELAEIINDYATQAACYNNLALLFSYKEKPYTVIQYYLKGIEIFDNNIKKEKSIKALMLANLGQFHSALGEYDKAVIYIERAFEVARRNKYTQILSIYADDYGRILTKTKQFEKATNIFAEGLKLNEALADEPSKVWNWTYQADLALAQKQCKKAEKWVNKAYNYALDKNMTENLTYNTLGLARVALCKKDYSKVLKYGKKILEIGKSSGRDLIIKTVNIEQEARKLIAEAMEAQGQFEQAYFFVKAYHEINDSIFQKQKLAQTIELEAKYRSHEKEKAIAYLQTEQEVTNRFINRLWTFVGIIVLAGLYILYLLYKRKEASQLIKKKNQELKKYIDSNLQLENFAFIASHDLRTPLSNIINFAQLLKRTTADRLQIDEMEYLNFIDNSAKDMTLLLNDIMAYSTLQNSQVKKEKINLVELVQEVLQQNEQIIAQHEVKIQTELATSFIKGDRSKLSQLLHILLNNSIKYRQPDKTPNIVLSAFTDNKSAVFSVKDNGIGIENTYFEKIFLLFKRLHNKKEYQGTGIGLALCKKIIDMHDGKIWVESTIGEGATFSFSLSK